MSKTSNGFFIQVPTKEKPFSGIFGTDVATPLGRLAFANTLVTPAAATASQKAKYGTAFLIPKDTGLHDKTFEQQKVHIKAIQDMCKLMVQDLWGDRAEQMLKLIKRRTFLDGDLPTSSGKVYDGYPNH